MIKSGAVFCGLLILLSAPLYAQTPLLPADNNTKPIEISAAQSLEWNRLAKTYTAHKNAIARQGNFEVQADTLTAYYSESGGATELTQIDALDHVVISSPPYTAFGDKAVYEIIKQQAVLTGKDLKITTPEDSLTAKNSITFETRENRLTATGDATASRGTDQLSADTLIAFFTQDAHGKTALKRIDASGHVIVKTQKETATGDQGVYDVMAGQAVLTGKVFVYQGENKLEGTRVVVDLKTGISQLFANETTPDGRVKGIFYPKSAPSQQKVPRHRDE